MFGLPKLYLYLGASAAALAVAGGLWLTWTVRGHELAAARAEAKADAAQIVNLKAQAAHAAKTQAISDASASAFAATQTGAQQRTADLLQKVPLYVTPQADAACPVPAGLVRLWNDAGAAGLPDNAVSPATAQPDGGAAGLALSDIARASVEAAGAFRQNAAQLKALQDWIRAQEAAAPDLPPT